MYFVAGHYRQPLAFSEAALEQAARERRSGSARPAGAWSRASARRGLGRLTERFFDALRRRLQHAEALAVLFEWVREADAPDVRRGGRRRRTCARCSGVLGLENLLDARGAEAPDGGRSSSPSSASRRARSATSPPPTRCATRSRRSAGRSATAPRASSSLPADVILYGRNPVREALRGRRGARAGRCGRRAGAAREPWLARRPVAHGRGAPRSSGAAAPTPTRAICAEADPYPLRRRRRAARRRPSRCSSRSTRSRTRRTSARSAARPSAPGATGVVIPERRAAEVTPAVCKASAGAVEHLRDRPRAQPRRLPRSKPATPAAGATARAGGAGRGPLRRARLRGGGVVLVLGAEGSGLRPRVASRVRRARSRLPLRGPDRLAERARRGRCAAVRDLAAPRSA